MTARRPMRLLTQTLAAIFALIGIGAIFAHSVHSADALKPTKNNVDSTSGCRQCHFRKDTKQSPDEIEDGFFHDGQASVWDENDKHRQSFLLLVDGDHRQLTEQILGFALDEVFPKDSAGKINTQSLRSDADSHKLATFRQCLACHAPIEEPVARLSATTTLHVGVSCQACHGPVARYQDPHQSRPWRVVTADAKEQVFGMRDVRNPLQRAELCTSCHVGSFSDEWKADAKSPPRFVKHEWYAKGHPPLPGFEYVAFSSQMPAHWRRIQEKPLVDKPFEFSVSSVPDDVLDRFFGPLPLSDQEKSELRKSGIAASYLNANRESLPSDDPAVIVADMARTKDVLVSGVAGLATYARMLREYPPDEPVDFALYDCGACHHELRSKPSKQVRVRRDLPPGRLPPAYWTLSLARQGATRTPQNAEFESALADLNRALGERPFGEPKAVRAAAAKLESSCLAIGRTLTVEPLDGADAGEILVSLANPQHDEDLDYHAARQHAWAIRTVLADLAGVPLRIDASQGQALMLERELPPPLKSLLHPEPGMESKAVYIQQKIDGLFGADDWHGPLRLRLPSGQRESVYGHVDQWLKTISSYDPELFRKPLDPIRRPK